MALLHLKSTNPNFGWVIAKNPATGLIAKEVKKGTMFGYFPNDLIYTIYFKDAPNEVSYKSYKEESFEYMNASRYNTPLFVIDAISEYFASLLKGDTESILEHDQTGFQNSIEINLVRLDQKKYLEIFPMYLPDFEVVAVDISKKNYKLFIKTQRSLVDLINYTALFMVFNILKNINDYIEINPDQMVKYLKCLSRLEVPYFMKYVFKVNLVRSPKVFKTYKEDLEKSATEKIEMVFGSTAQQRLEAVRNRLTFTSGICEIGCSDGFQTIHIAKTAHAAGLPVYAIDPDPVCRDKVMHRTGRKNLDNVTVLESFEAFKALNPIGPFDVLMVEVIEHMSMNDAMTLFKNVLHFCAKRERSRLILTTPNRDFNQFYAIEGFRHEDHQFEFTEDVFDDWVNQAISDVSFAGRIKPFEVGDKVNDIPTTLGVQIDFDGEL